MYRTRLDPSGAQLSGRLPVEQVVHEHRSSAAPPQREDLLSWRGPVASNALHNLGRGEKLPVWARSDSKSPRKPSAWPYIGDESMTPPPAAKKRCNTSRRCARCTRSSPTSKVSQVPMPTAGRIRAREEGTLQMVDWARAAVLALRKAADEAWRKVRRRMNERLRAAD